MGEAVLRRKCRLTLSSIADRYLGSMRGPAVRVWGISVGRARAPRYGDRSNSAFYVVRRALHSATNAQSDAQRWNGDVHVCLRPKVPHPRRLRFFSENDQSKLAADAGIKLRPSTLLVFGNPPLGIQFITANPNAGLDWPVRLLVTQADDGSVWTVYSDFGWIARRHGIKSRDAQFRTATEVIASITSSVAAKK
jgi:uncharacterized protein (DUF302 family)